MICKKTWALTLGFWAAASPAAPVVSEKISVCIPAFREEFLTLALLEAKDRGLFAREGLDVTFVTSQPSSGGEQLVQAAPGRIPARTLGDFNVADRVAGEPRTCAFGSSAAERFLIGGGTADVLAKTQPLMVSNYGGQYDTHLVVLKDSAIRKVKDLKGKKIRIGQVPTQIALHRLLDEENLKLSDVEQVFNVGTPEILAKLQSGEIDAAMSYVPTMPYMLASGKVRVLKSNIIHNYVQDTVPHSVLIVNRDFARESPETVKRFTRAVDAAVSYISRNPSSVVYAMERNTGLLGLEKWPVDKAVAEKASAFVGQLKVAHVYGAGESLRRKQSLESMRAYGGLLKALSYSKSEADLAHWMGVL